MNRPAISPSEVQDLFKELPPVEPDRFWNQCRIQLRKDVLEKGPQDFLNFQVVKHTMNVGDTLLRYEDPVLFGRPYPEEEKIRLGKDWGNYCHQAHHLRKFMDYTDKHPDDFDVVEIGGGFGMMRRLFSDWLIDKSYTIVDLPEFCILQRYYLERNGIFNTEWLSLDDFIWSDRKWDLLIACWSLSEIEERPEPAFFDKAQNYLIAYQRKHDGLPFSNVDWFGQFKKTIKRNWVEEEISFLPGNLYLAGA